MAQRFCMDHRTFELCNGFTSVLLKWRCSLYKLCGKELICLLLPYVVLAAIYRQALNDDQKSLFEQLIRYFDRYSGMVSIPFVLGFYVSTIATRWWQQYMALPWPDRLISVIATYIPGYDAKSRMLRKTLVRQCNLMAVLLMRTLCSSRVDCVKTLDDAVRAGFMSNAEMMNYQLIQSGESAVNLYWLPGLWFTQNLQTALSQGHIKDNYGVKLIMEELLEFRGRCGTIWLYAWINIPLLYTQTVILATYSFLFAGIIGRQRIVDPEDEDGILTDVYIVLAMIFEFFFYMGLLKVATHMVNPDRDEHFDVEFLLKRHAKVIELGTDKLSDQCPAVTSEELLIQNTEENNIKKSQL